MQLRPKAHNYTLLHMILPFLKIPLSTLCIFWHCMIISVVPICYHVDELGTVYVCISVDIVFFIITFLFGLYV